MLSRFLRPASAPSSIDHEVDNFASIFDGSIQRMEASNGVVRGVIESLTKVMAALEAAGIEFINEGAASTGGGRGVRLRNQIG